LDKQVIGGKVTFGTIREKSPVIIMRAGAQVGNGRILNLQQQKKDVHQASDGEAGLKVSSNIAIQVGDKLVIA
jgi:translation initiation factor IF-2